MTSCLAHGLWSRPGKHPFPARWWSFSRYQESICEDLWWLHHTI